MNEWFWHVPTALTSALVGGLGFWIIHRFRVGDYEQLAAEIVQRAEADALSIQQQSKLELKEKEMDLQRDFEQAWHKERRRLQVAEEKIQAHQDRMEEHLSVVEKKMAQVDSRESALQKAKDSLSQAQSLLQKQQEQMRCDLEKIAGLTRSEARDELLRLTREEIAEDSARLTQSLIKEAEDNAESKAKSIISNAINRLAVPCCSEVTVKTLALPSDEMKGRIIGREGRNIRALERATGVNVIIDDTPSTVVISGFDPVRKHIAKQALSDLIADGRIHPTRIEEVVERVSTEVEQSIQEHGRDAALRAGAHGLHDELITLLGRMAFRHSYGQNLLEHSLEVSHLLGLMAAELGLDERLARRIGLLHDIGKAVSHEVSGTHAIIGYNLAMKYGENEAVANGIGCHHNEMDPQTIEGSLCGAADALSAARPGARVEAVESYIQRVHAMETLAKSFTGVDQAYALQAGRELRVTVQPDQLDDAAALQLARDLAKRIEAELRYPGKIKITIVREKRAVHYAL